MHAPAHQVLELLRKRPHSARQLIKKTGRIDLVGLMREINDAGAVGPIVAARGTNDMGGICQVYWIPPQRMGRAWRRHFAAFNVDPDTAEVV